jgi:carbon monoxide dehydrogenase subunit G
MELSNTFLIPAPIDEAWDFLLDVERVALCFPGASVDRVDGEAFSGRVRVKLGPVAFTYVGTGRFVERDESAHRAVIEGAGRDSRGASTAKATVTTRLDGRGTSTEATVSTQFVVTGKPAQFSRGIMQEVSARMIDQFAGRLAEMLAAASTDHPADSAHPAADSSLRAATPVVHQADMAGQAMDLAGVAGPAVAKRAAALIAVCVMAWTLLRRRKEAGPTRR